MCGVASDDDDVDFVLDCSWDLPESRDALQPCWGPCQDDLISQLDSDSEWELDEEGDTEVSDDAALLEFAVTLQKAHDIVGYTYEPDLNSNPKRFLMS